MIIRVLGPIVGDNNILAAGTQFIRLNENIRLLHVEVVEIILVGANPGHVF